MLKSDMQHQFWITKKTVQRKLGSKEDEHIISSDAQLDAKVDIYKSISASSAELSKIIDQYQERLCVLSQEESTFGRFLKDTGKRSKTTGQTISSAGKSVSYCGQQRMCIRVPLLRLQHEVDVFRYRAITDMQNTIAVMEKERTEYRAALEWMKSVSIELDPDTGRGLEKFRTSQTHVRNAKSLFDNVTLNSIQKIDLLAAARCNMLSHVLVSYVSELKQFAQKTNTTFAAISKVIEQKPKYDFLVLKKLTQQEENGRNVSESCTTELFDKDQSFFFADDYKDSKSNSSKSNEGSIYQEYNSKENNAIVETVPVNADILSKIVNSNLSDSNVITPSNPSNYCERNKTESKSICCEVETCLKPSGIVENKSKTRTNSKNTWAELFADLDPLGNLESFDLKLSATTKNLHRT